METDFGYGCLGTNRTSFTQPPPGTSWVFWTQGNSFAPSLANLSGVDVRLYGPSIGYIRIRMFHLIGTVQQRIRITFGSTEIVL